MVFRKAQITCFLQIFISNKYFKIYICIQEQGKTLNQKSEFPYKTAVHVGDV